MSQREPLDLGFMDLSNRPIPGAGHPVLEGEMLEFLLASIDQDGRDRFGLCKLNGTKEAAICVD